MGMGIYRKYLGPFRLGLGLDGFAFVSWIMELGHDIHIQFKLFNISDTKQNKTYKKQINLHEIVIF